jgi:hypothetical protein
MRSVRSLLVGAVLMALTTLAACGGGTGASTAATPTQGTGASSAGEPTDQPGATPTENPGGGGVGDLASLIEKLTPPNSTQTSRTDASGGAFVSWESTDSVDSLKGFYESAIPSTGMQIFSSTNASGTFSWIFAESDGSTHGGSVTIAPSSSGGSGSTVLVTVSAE